MYEVIFDDALSDGDFYRTQSNAEGIYEQVAGGYERSTVPNGMDLNSVPTRLSDQFTHPLRVRNGANPGPGARPLLDRWASGA